MSMGVNFLRASDQYLNCSSIILLAAAEACIALAIVLAIFRSFKDVDIFKTSMLKE